MIGISKMPPAEPTRRRSNRPLALFLCLWLVLAGGPAAAARHALVIGNQSYANIKKLHNAKADAEAMSASLRRAQYEVLLVTDRSLREMQADVRLFRSRIKPGDEVVLFYSGHGVQLGGLNYLLPLDVGSGSEEQVKDESIALTKLLSDLRTHRPALTLAIIDACRDNPFEGISKSMADGLAGVAGATGQMVIYAAGEGQKALDRLSRSDPARIGVFTRIFVREMAKPGVSIRDVVFRVRDEVATLAETVKHEQVPAVYDQVRGTFYFVPPQAGQAGAPPPSQPPQPLPAPVAACSYCPEMVVISAGSFVMGSPGSEPERDANEGPQRTVSVASFEMGKYEVTQRQWKAVMGSNPSHFSACGDDCPVENVSWDDAQAYIRKLNEMTGRRYRLPSEAEWEYAARARTDTAFHTGPTISAAQANFDGRYSYNGSAKGEYRQKTTRVGSFVANAWGLHDMHGNVWEWVQDVWHDNYVGAPSDGTAWANGGDQARRVLRGGSWGNFPQNLRSANRGRSTPDYRGSNAGFRIARIL